MLRVPGQAYTASFKLRVVEEAEKTSNRGAGRKFGVNQKLVRDANGCSRLGKKYIQTL